MIVESTEVGWSAEVSFLLRLSRESLRTKPRGGSRSDSKPVVCQRQGCWRFVALTDIFRPAFDDDSASRELRMYMSRGPSSSVSHRRRLVPMRFLCIASAVVLLSSTGLVASGCSDREIVFSSEPDLTLTWGRVPSGAATAGEALDQAVTVRVQDETSLPVPGILVSFEVTRGGGTLSRNQVYTDDSGEASTAWTLGMSSGLHEVRARSEGTREISLRIDATGGNGDADPPVLLYEETWDYPSTDALAAASSLNQRGAGVVIERGLSSLPWGGSAVVRADFPGGVRSFTAGVDLLPEETRVARLREVWVEVWVRFDDNWRTGAGGIGDHKTLFLLPDPTPSNRWEIKAGLFGVDLVGEIANGTVHKETSCLPPVGAGGACPSARKPQLPSLLWDGQWHLIRWHARMSGGNGYAPDGVHAAWIDDTKVLESAGMVTGDPGKFFSRIALGRNADPVEAASIRWGRVRVFSSDPGWR